jgi:hypothetical protein
MFLHGSFVVGPYPMPEMGINASSVPNSIIKEDVGHSLRKLHPLHLTSAEDLPATAHSKNWADQKTFAITVSVFSQIGSLHLDSLPTKKGPTGTKVGLLTTISKGSFEKEATRLKQDIIIVIIIIIIVIKQ